jgi:hypothetical protein
MTVAPVIVQRRFMQLGRVRLGEKGSKGEPRKLDNFRFTSASRALLEAVAAKYGGKVQEWQGAPDEGYFELKTTSTELDIILPPTFSDEDGSPSLPWSQFFELWSGGGCQRRCDGVTETLSGKPCLCDPDDRACDVTTRVQFMLPDIPGLGVWRLDSKGWNAAAELPGTLQLLQLAAEERKFIPAVLRMEKRTKKVEGQTRRFVVPVIDLPSVSVNQLAGGDLLSLNAPAPAPPRPALPAAPAPPADPSFEGTPDFGQRPPLPTEPEPEPQPARDEESARAHERSSVPPPEEAAEAGSAAASSSPFKPPSRIAPPAPPALPDELTKVEFNTLLEEYEIPAQTVRAAGSNLFPGKTKAQLSDSERGTLWKVLQTAEPAQETLA